MISPRRIVLILPCCIGDVVLATATLQALRRAYPQAYIAWAVGSWSKPAIEHHPLLDAVIDTGNEALPVKSIGGMLRFVRQLRAGKFDLAVSLVRSPLMSVAVLLSGIPKRAGLDSAGRGFGYNIKAMIDPNAPRHEAVIYLDTARCLGIDTRNCRANIPVSDADRQSIRAKLDTIADDRAYIVINPAGGRNPGMVMDVKRWPAANFAELANRFGLPVVLIGGKGDETLVEAVKERLTMQATAFVGTLSFGEIAALARGAKLYIGNDTGLTHLAAAAGAKTVMILGPSDPKRYAPFADDALALWKPTAIQRVGVAAGAPTDWDWTRDGISVDEAEQKIRTWLGESSEVK
ncbi:MAG: glycosyltransferase family 9 protein [Chloroflexota bacterium]